MKISNVVLNAMLDNEFYGTVTSKTYDLKVLIDGGTQPASIPIDFKEAVAGVTELDSSVFFPIAAGTKVIGLQVIDDNTDILVEESIPEQDYSDNGTLTVNNIVITLSGE